MIYFILHPKGWTKNILVHLFNLHVHTIFLPSSINVSFMENQTVFVLYLLKVLLELFCINCIMQSIAGDVL